MKAEIRKAEPWHAAEIAQQMRGASIQEVSALGLDSVALIETALRRARHAWVGYLDEEIVCMWAITSPSILSDTGYIWMITTRAVEAHPFVFLRQSQIFLKEAMQYYRVLHGDVSVHFTRSIQWLKWLGFTVSNTDGVVRHFRMDAK